MKWTMWISNIYNTIYSLILIFRIHVMFIDLLEFFYLNTVKLNSYHKKTLYFITGMNLLNRQREGMGLTHLLFSYMHIRKSLYFDISQY